MFSMPQTQYRGNVSLYSRVDGTYWIASRAGMGRNGGKTLVGRSETNAPEALRNLARQLHGRDAEDAMAWARELEVNY